MKDPPALQMEEDTWRWDMEDMGYPACREAVTIRKDLPALPQPRATGTAHSHSPQPKTTHMCVVYMHNTHVCCRHTQHTYVLCVYTAHMCVVYIHNTHVCCLWKWAVAVGCACGSGLWQGWRVLSYRKRFSARWISHIPCPRILLHMQDWRVLYFSK